MADNICISLKADGERCGAKRNVRIGDGTLCKMHFNSKETNGPNAYTILQLMHAYTRDVKLLNDAYNTILENGTEEQIMETNALYGTRRDEIRQTYDIRRTQTRLEQQLEIQRTGIDPDAPARERREAARQQREVRRRGAAVPEREIIIQHGILLNANHIQDMVNLGQFARDAQNVHTSAAVNQTKEIVAKIRAIPVPEGYRWNMTECSKTPFEIGMACSLTPKATWQMISQYAQDTAIYDIEPGIYGKVLDGVWQFIKTSPEKESLCKVIKEEMQDNIGMCAQGNLSRICNILAGYMEGVGSQECTTEILGRLLPPLMSIEDATERMDAARKILGENNVPREEWYEWLDALRD